MKIKLCVFAGAILVFGMMATACAKPPTEEMNNAIEAVARAENDIDAVTYAESSVTRARNALTRMQAEAEARRYDAAKSLAAEAIAAAERAISEGRAGADRSRNEASTIVSELGPLVEEVGQNIATGRDAGLLLDFNEVDRNFDNACREADEAQAALAESRYADTINLGRSARSGLVSINQQLSSAAISLSRKK